MIKRKYRSTLARDELDRMFADARPRDFAVAPDQGWIRSIRDALGMTSRELARRMGQSQAAVSQLERSEVAGRAQLDSLRRAAEALDCHFVYAFVPRTSLEETLHARACTIARRDLGDQAVDPEALEERIEHNAARLVAGGRLWDDRDADSINYRS